jgi:hypothetical protein
MTVRIGLDVGGVIIRFHGHGARKGLRRLLFFLRAKPIPGAFHAIRTLVEEYGADNIVIISKVKTTWETRLWLRCHRFYDRTGFQRQNLHFCRERHEKGAIADHLPGGPLTHFVDDRADVLCHMPNVGTRYLFGRQKKVGSAPTDAFVPAFTWWGVLQHLGLASMPFE